MPQDVLKVAVKRDKGLLQKEMVTTRLQQKVMLRLLVVQDKIRKIVQTTHMLLDVSLQQKVMLRLLQKEMVTTHLQQKVMLRLLVVQDKIRKIVETTHMLLDVSLQQKVLLR